MAKGYWVAQMDVTDAETYDIYRAANAEAFAAYGARFLVRGGTHTQEEGKGRSRTVVLEFPSYADALACYHSDAYQSAKSIRLNAAEGELVIVEGYES